MIHDMFYELTAMISFIEASCLGPLSKSVLDRHYQVGLCHLPLIHDCNLSGSKTILAGLPSCKKPHNFKEMIISFLSLSYFITSFDISLKSKSIERMNTENIYKNVPFFLKNKDEL